MKYSEQTYINADYAISSGQLSIREARREYTKLRDIENKRVQRLQASAKWKNKPSVQAIQKLPETRSLSDKDIAEWLTKAYARVSKGTSSAKRYREKRAQFKQNLIKAGLDPKHTRTQKQIEDLEILFDKIGQIYKSKYSIYNVVNLYEEAYSEAEGNNANKTREALRAIERAYIS